MNTRQPPREVHDLRWTDEPLASEPVSGMSESLAHGLVTRFVEQWRQADVVSLMRHPPPLKQKRAAAYRANCAWLSRSVPKSLQIMVVRSGPQNGVDKSGRYALLHWEPADDEDWLIVGVQLVCANQPGVESRLLTLVSRHALVRAFQRLKTDDPRVVLDELAPSIELYWDLRPFHVALGRPIIMVPTRRGGVLVAPHEETPNAVFFKTWISDERMVERPGRLRAMQRARAEKGMVLMVDGRFAVFSEASFRHSDTRQAIASCLARLPRDEEDVPVGT
jgi:hypothetical protein